MKPFERQRQREIAQIAAEIVDLEQRKRERKLGLRPPLDRSMIAAHRQIVRKAPPPSAEMARHFEAIKDPRQVDRPEKPADTITMRAVTLVDTMHKAKIIPMHLAHAAWRFRALFYTAIGKSAGVGNYGDYVPSAGHNRIPTTAEQMEAREIWERAASAAFGVVDIDGRWRYDQQLMNLLVPAIIFDHKGITQAHIGRERTGYSGRAQVGSAGGTAISEALHKLALFFVYSEH